MKCNALFEPPPFIFSGYHSATIVSDSYTIIDGETVSFRCLTNVTAESSVLWVGAGNNQSLPHGVFQRENDLVITWANRFHAGEYLCSVTVVGRTTSDVLTVSGKCMDCTYNIHVNTNLSRTTVNTTSLVDCTCI